MNILCKAVILGLSVTCLGTAGNIKTAHASTKVTQYKNLKTAQYTVARGSKGFLYKQATLKTKVQSIKKYSKVKFTVSKEAIVKRSNGKIAVYYYVKSSKVSGWLWHDYLNKIAVKKSSTGLNTSQQKQIANLQQQISDLKQQLSELKAQTNPATVAPATTSTDVSSQIFDLQSQLNALKGSDPDTNQVTNHPADDENAANIDPFNGKSTEYYVSSPYKIYLYPDSQGKGYPIIIGDMNEDIFNFKTVQVYDSNYTKDVEHNFWRTTLIPVEYNNQKGYIDSNCLTVVPVNESFNQLGDAPDQAGYGNVAPTEVTFTKPLINGSTWRQYSKDAQWANIIYWKYDAINKTWSKQQ